MIAEQKSTEKVTRAPVSMVVMDDATRGRFWSKVSKGDGCWLWAAAVNPFGYGRFCVSGSTWLAHRIAWMDLVGDIPEGLTLDHLCRTPPCCRPDHLEPVALQVNILRERGWGDGFCKRGHRLSPENVYIAPKSGKRQCKGCWKVRKASYKNA